MARGGADSIGKPSDVFALGLIITEMFTKQNSRGARHQLVRDRYPFLSDVDLLTERMLLQDETQRISVEAVRDSLRTIRRHVHSMIEDIAEQLRSDETPTSGATAKAELTLEQAARDVLSAKYIFERATDEELSRYDPNYHCEVGYRASTELFNTCVQAKLYSMCKAKFEYESNGQWSDSDNSLVSSPDKARLQSELESILTEFPLAPNSIWAGFPRRAAHYFRFCKDYHREELIKRIRDTISDQGAGSLRSNLLNAPIIWMARSVRNYLRTDYLRLDQRALQQVEFERQVAILWTETLAQGPSRSAVGADLFNKTHNANDVARILAAFAGRWNVSLGERVDGSYSVHFSSADEYGRFRAQALDVASPYYVFEGDVLDLLRPEAEYDDLVALVWDRDFQVLNTLAKVLGLREI